MKRPLPPQFYNPLLATREKQLRTSVFPWEIEILLREIIINCTEIGGKKFKDWNSISRPINLIKNIGNLAFANHNSQKDDVLFEIIRIAHRQFPWQIGINRHDLSKYFELYNNKYLYRRIYDIFGIEVRELFQLTLSLAGHFVNEPILTYPIENQLNSVNDGVFIDLIKKFSISFDTLKKKTIENQRYDVNWAYTSNPLRHHPIIDFDGKILICPIVDFLIRRVSSGIYYDLLDVPNVAGRFLGPAVQEIIGKIARSEIKGMRMLAERDYRGKKNRKDTIDWIISDESAHI
ncbi:MAG TPA: hypothetical protein VHN58_12100, partial [Croceicoccus sp.]|nr:hypothetical protein [Croceicoccus sp.]